MIKKLTKTIAAVFIILFFMSCDILRDSPFEVLEWSPGSGYCADPEKVSVSVLFSHDPDRESVEKYFSFTGDNESVRGVYQWEGKRMKFLPYLPLEINKDYSISISPNAHDRTGLSMDREFEGRFSTRPNPDRPSAVSFSPEIDGIMEQDRDIFVIEFNRPISLNSLRSSASFNPSMPGAWHLKEDTEGAFGTLAVFTPAEPWPQGKRMVFHLSASLAGSNGMETGRDFHTVFFIGEERGLPGLLGAWRLTSGGKREKLVSHELGEFIENPGWEKDDKLFLAFSSPVDLLSVGTALSVEGASTITLEMPNGTAGFSSEAVFNFDKPPAYESRFSFRLRRGVKDMPGNESGDEHLFRIFANGENSKPPSLAGIRIPIIPDGSHLCTYSTDRLFDDLPIQSENYPYNVKTATWIECYFDSATGAEIDPFSLMELFRIETSNNVIIFSPLVVLNNNFSAANPHPSWEGYQRLEIRGNLTNTTNAGLVHFIINRGLKDSQGNTSEKQSRISLIK